MRRIAALLLLSVVSLRAESAMDAIRTMVDSERNFCVAAKQKGTRAAFLDFFADNAIIFRPGPVNGKEVWRNRTTDLELIWEPTLAGISRSADLGYDTGPSKWRVDKSKEEWTHAYYISIWKKAPDGSWKVALDCGTENFEPTMTAERLELHVPDETQGVRGGSFADAQTEFIAAAREGFASAVDKFGSDEVRVYREGKLPVVGKTAAIRALSAHPRNLHMEILRTEVSSGGDLAYYYGKHSEATASTLSQGYFLQIWRTSRDGRWRLELDWQQPLPPAK